MTIVRNPPQPTDGTPPLPAVAVRAETPAPAAGAWPTGGLTPIHATDEARAGVAAPQATDEAWCDRAAASLAAAASAADEAAAGVAAVQRAGTTLADEVRRIRDALATGRVVIERLRQRVEAEAGAAAAARAAAAALATEHDRLIEEHDAFLAAILEEEEEARRALRAQQSRTEARLTAVEAELDEARRDLQRVHANASRSPSGPAGPEALPNATPVEDVRALRNQIATLETRVEELTRERERAREMLLRLQAQRDEASRAALELKRSLTPPPGAGAATRIGPDHAPDSPGYRSATPAPPAAGEIEAPLSEGRASALARALAATHPLRRASEPPGDVPDAPPPPAGSPAPPPNLSARPRQPA